MRPPKSRRILLVASLAMLGLSLALLWPREPSWQGRGLSEWLEDYSKGHNEIMKARTALRQMGPDAVPWLTGQLRLRDGKVRSVWLRLANRQHWFPTRSRPAQVQHQRALQALVDLGPDGFPAVPELARHLGDPQMHAMVLGAICQLEYGDGRPRLKPAGSLPLLLAMLEHPEVQIRSMTLIVLGSQCPDYDQLMPALVARLKDPDARVRASVAASFFGLDQRDDLVVPALVASMEDPDSRVRVNAARALGNKKGKAQGAIPALVRRLDDEEASVRQAAKAALSSIQPQPAASTFFPKPPDLL